MAVGPNDHFKSAKRNQTHMWYQNIVVIQNIDQTKPTDNLFSNVKEYKCIHFLLNCWQHFCSNKNK